ncbi:MAG TPA: hypothetical protein QGG59_05120 [Planctomycetota bacterium]|nr:hypothetical protein [Planctomycetota bacterium]MDP6129337.1 hypothetical protein [Planctomycetota bacterium]MDP7244992.1 hypothetical protein [Planctomycetota bacterium]HJM39478.1 hypothetical protein [Planctomycetota bacterium]
MKNLTLALAALSLAFFACATPGECGSNCSKPCCDAAAKAECGSNCAKSCCAEKKEAQCCKDAKALGKKCAGCAK